MRFYLFMLIVLPLMAFPYEKVRVYEDEIQRGIYNFYADNLSYAPYQVIVYIRNENGAKEEFYSVINEKSLSNFLFSYTNSSAKNIKYYYRTFIGDPLRVNLDTNYIYLLPFAHNSTFKVNQAYGTRFTHRGNLKYSIDFGMKVGTPIFAARDGVVVAVRDTSSTGGRSRRYRGQANYITIAHEDGSFAQYVHLRFAGSLVKEGDVVKAGDLIGYSGATGRVTGPHLHFMVYIPVKAGLMTIPVRFLISSNEVAELKSKNFYTAYHPGHVIPYSTSDNVIITNTVEDSFGEP